MQAEGQGSASGKRSRAVAFGSWALWPVWPVALVLGLVVGVATLPHTADYFAMRAGGAEGRVVVRV
mgnify:CR=1 FL=1